MPDLDLYLIHHLDRGRSPADLAAQLTAELNSTTDALTLQRVETARAILGDPQRRARYDAMLADPSVTVDEAALAGLAGRPVPRRSAFAEPKAKILAAVVAALALVLVIAVIAVVAGGGSDDKTGTDQAAAPGSSEASQRSPSPSDAAVAPCWPADDNGALKSAAWDDADSDFWPSAAVVVDLAIDLPAQFNKFAEYTASGVTTGTYEGINQLQDGKIAVAVSDSTGPTMGALADALTVVVVDKDGTVGPAQNYKWGKQPLKSDLANSASRGYYRVEATEGITLPESARGTESIMLYANAVLADAYDDTKAWLLLRGSSTLYRATVYQTSTIADSVTDLSKCAK